jgi:hypothetical protein
MPIDSPVLDCHVLKSGLGESEGNQWLAGHDTRCDLRHGHRRRLRDEGHGPAGPRIDLEHVDMLALDGILHVHQADDAEPAGHQTSLSAQLGLYLGRQGEGRQGAGGVTRVHPRLFDLLHNAGDVDIRAV